MYFVGRRRSCSQRDKRVVVQEMGLLISILLKDKLGVNDELEYAKF